ncbi:MAG TPA: hypothetical protein VHV57_12810 [Acidimicrobiales bacterium]|jgi:hypothetical protein|nr:hypothetical protein [Acidimicrobiales bacterium]
MDLPSKLQIKPGQQLLSVLTPESVEPALVDVTASRDDGATTGLIVFTTDRSALEQQRTRIAESALGDRLTWVAYPKAGQLGTDLNRDLLAALLEESGLQPVRQVAIDGIWSALRFRPA